MPTVTTYIMKAVIVFWEIEMVPFLDRALNITQVH